MVPNLFLTLNFIFNSYKVSIPSTQSYLTRIRSNDRYCGYLHYFKASMCYTMKSETRKKTLTKHSIVIHFRKSPSPSPRWEVSFSFQRKTRVFFYFSFAALRQKFEKIYKGNRGLEGKYLWYSQCFENKQRLHMRTRVRSLFILVVPFSFPLVTLCRLLGKGNHRQRFNVKRKSA